MEAPWTVVTEVLERRDFGRKFLEGDKVGTVKVSTVKVNEN